MSNAVKYTSKLDVKYQIQQRQPRTAHEDDHYCLALFKMQRAMSVELATSSQFVCLDDKAKVPFGEPKQVVSTGVRNRPGIAVGGAHILALDHDQASKGSLTPSVVLECEIPESTTGSFYRGNLHVFVKDTVLQPSTPARHAAELSALLATGAQTKLVLFAFTDGGSDHRSTFLSVQLAWILLFLELDLDMIITCRTAPGHSYMNPAECCMSVLNLGLQNCGLARSAASNDMEKHFKTCNSMDALRKLQPVIKKAWSESVAPVRKLVEGRFNCLLYADSQVQVHDPAADDKLSTFFARVSQVDPEIDVHDTAPRQKGLKDKGRLSQFLVSHCQQRQYSFQIRKCGKAVCEFNLCKPPRLPASQFESLSWLPDPAEDETNPWHYKQYCDVKGTATTDGHRPSLQKQAGSAEAEKQGCTTAMFTAQRVRGVVDCGECAKPRCIFSKNALAPLELTELFSAVHDTDYTCGSPLLPDNHPLAGKVFVRTTLRCQDTVELAYYSSKLNLPGICCYCTNESASRPQEFLAQFFTVLPICGACQSVRPVVTRMPKADSKRKRSQQ